MNHKHWIFLTLLSATLVGCATTDAIVSDTGRDGLSEQQALPPLLTKSAENGDAEAQFALGKALETGLGVSRNVEEAAQWYRRAAEQGHAAAQFHLGAMHGRGEGVERNYPEAVRLYKKAAEGGYRDAFYPVAYAYENGIGVEKSLDEALRWYVKSAEHGVHFAMERIGRAYAAGELGLQANSKLAEEWHAKAKAAMGGQKPLPLRNVGQ